MIYIYTKFHKLRDGLFLAQGGAATLVEQAHQRVQQGLQRECFVVRAATAKIELFKKLEAFKGIIVHDVVVGRQ